MIPFLAADFVQNSSHYLVGILLVEPLGRSGSINGRLGPGLNAARGLFEKLYSISRFCRISTLMLPFVQYALL